VRVNDFVFLGTAIPAESQRYGYTICAAGFSPMLRGFLRLYPMPWPKPPTVQTMRWRMYALDLERPAPDSRVESWKVVPPNWSGASDQGPFGRKAGVEWLLTHRATSIASLNDCRLSLGVLVCAPRTLRLVGRINGAGAPTLLFDREVACGPVTKAQAPLWPVVKFCDPRGEHTLQLVDWGSYLLLWRGYALDDLARQLCFGDPTRAHLLLVGNQANARNSWLAIAVIPIAAELVRADDPQRSLFDCIGNGEGAADAAHSDDQA
jgi:hypothetical protein